MRLPGSSVVLKRNLRDRSVSFVRCVIAHELAHAHLRNRGRFPGDDPELAADSLAAAWGVSQAASLIFHQSEFFSVDGFSIRP